MNHHQRGKRLSNNPQKKHCPKNLREHAHHKSSYQGNSHLDNIVEKNLKQDIHRSNHLELHVLHPPSNQEVVELMMFAVIRDPKAAHENVISLEVDLHMITTRGLLTTSHVIGTRNQGADLAIGTRNQGADLVIGTRNRGADLGISTEGLGHVSVLLGDGVDLLVTELDGAINVGEADHMIVSDEADLVKDTKEIETHVEPEADMTEGKILILLIRMMIAVNLKSAFCDKCLFLV